VDEAKEKRVAFSLWPCLEIDPASLTSAAMKIAVAHGPWFVAGMAKMRHAYRKLPTDITSGGAKGD
jgi:hypothetical protein